MPYDRILLDANALLNGALVAESWSRIAIEELRQKQRAAFFVGTATVREAIYKARVCARKYNKQTDPAEIIDQYIRHLNALQVDHGDVQISNTIPREDRHVVEEAQTARAMLLTSDARLLVACKQLNQDSVASPLEVIQRFQGVGIGTTIFGPRPTQASGYIFAAIGFPPGGIRTVIESDNCMWIHYNGQNDTWNVELAGRPHKLQIKHRPDVQIQQRLVVSWNAKRMQLRVAPVVHPVELKLSSGLPNPLGNLTIGHDARGQHHINGFIRHIVWSDTTLGKDSWAMLQKHPEITPNPFDEDRLERVIRDVLP